ncbi:MAG: hypothetical protein KC468_39310, partial [Myxococcales bacterium]|nr:hypothetical protein [Myxococcales bacterium]
MPRSALILGLLIMSACGAPPQDDSSTSGITTVSPDDSSSSSNPLIQTVTSNVSQADASGPTDVGASTTGSTGATSIFTSGDHPDFGDSDGPVGCGGKIDFLFLISRRAHMAPKQAALSASLPGFISTIKSKFDDFDVHIMVVGAEPAGWGIAACEEACWDDNLQSCEPDGPSDYPCWAYAGNELTACDQAFGAGVTFPAGFQSTNERCDLAGGNRYIIDEEPDLETAFECVSRLGVLDKNGTLPGLAIEYALSPESLGPGGCNEGFIRDDALLVLTIVT